MDQEADNYIEILEEESKSHDSQLLPPQEEYNQETISEILRQQPIFFEMEVQQGNFDLLLLHNPESWDDLDSSGYSILHHAISYARLDVIRYLLSKGANPNVKSKLKQSCLMMACNFGIRELVILFIDLGNQINETDDRLFTPLLYAIKSKQHAIALYLIALGADINVKDDQDCTLLHWAAYNDDSYVLKYFEGSENIDAKDAKGKSPLLRAITNYSNQSVKYLLTRYPQLMPEQSIDLKTFAMKRIVENIKFEQFIRKLNLRCYQFIILSFFYFLISILIIGNFQRLIAQDSYGYGIQLVSLFATMYSAFYTIIFLFKTTLRQDQGVKISDKLGHPKISYECNSNHNDHEHQHHILEEEYKLDDPQFDSNNTEPGQQLPELLIMITFTFENNDQFQIFDITRTCPTCKIIQKKQTFHCEYCNKCILGFHFHSIYLNRCINSSNHFFYFLLIITYQITFLLIIWATLYNLSSDESYYRLIFKPIYSDFNLPELSTYSLLIIGLYFTTIKLLISIICIFSNRTEHELLHSENYKYLYELQKIKTFYFMKLKQIEDIFDNAKTYIWNQFTELRLL